MAVHHGKDGVVKLGTATVASVTAFAFSSKLATVSKAVMGDVWDTKLAGLRDGSGSIECLLDPMDTTGQELLLDGTTVHLKLYPQGTATGAYYWDIPAALITGTDLSNTMTSPSTRKFSFELNGVPSWTDV